MSETPHFIAQQLREVADTLRDATPYSEPPPNVTVTRRYSLAVSAHDGTWVDICAALEQFAQRLEQEEQQQTAFAATEGAAYTTVPYEDAKALRDEGRQQERSKPLEVLQADNGDILICYQPAGAYPASPVPFHDMRQQGRIENAKSTASSCVPSRPARHRRRHER